MVRFVAVISVLGHMTLNSHCGETKVWPTQQCATRRGMTLESHCGRRQGCPIRRSALCPGSRDPEFALR